MTEGLVRAVELNNLLFSAALPSLLVSGSGSHPDLTLVDAIEGEEMIFEAVSAPTYGPGGVQLGTVTVMRDVTELRRADQELRLNYQRLSDTEEVVRQDRDRLNLIIENVGDPIVVCDSKAGIVLVDPLAQELFGSEHHVSPDTFQFQNRNKLTAFISSFTSSLAERETTPLRLYNPALRQEIEYDARSGKIFGERGQLAYTVTVLRDLTALRRVEQLKVERRMLEIEKFAATGRLAATIAHEVNNPMEAIKNAIYLLAGAIPESAAPVYNILKSETERVARIVRQMLGLYRNTEQVKAVNVNTIIEDTLLLLNRQLQRVNVEVQTELEELPDAVIAADQIRQVLSNLVINARDAMPNGGRLRIRTRHIHRQDDLRGWVRIIVADTGSGIPPEMIRSIFEPFVTTKGERGTGLGLWIVKGIIQNHGGKLSVRSRLGYGTTFRIDLPVAKL
jgi:signal transduction histidine kinase